MWCLQPFRKYADFSGRARRREYWGFKLLVGLVAFVLGVITAAAGSPDIFWVLTFLFVLYALIPGWAVLVRRMHDTDRSGWWLLLLLLPVIGPLIILVLTLCSGTPGPNRFGPDPKADLTPVSC